MNINLIEAIDNAKVDSDIAVAESMIMCYDKQLLLMEYESPVDIFQEGKIMDDVKEQGKDQTKAQKVLTFIPRLLKAIFKAIAGKLSKVGDSAKKVAEASKKVPAEANKKIASAFNKSDKKGLSSALKAILITTASLGFGILLAKFASKYAEKISYLKMRWKHLKENPQNARDDKTDKLIMKIMPVLTKLENIGKNNEKLDNKAAKNLIEDVNDIVEIISDEKDAPKVDAEYKETLTETVVLFTNLQKDCKANDDTKKDEKPKQTEEKKPESDDTKKDEKPAEQKPDTQEASDDKDSKAVDAFVEKVLTDEVKELIRLGLFEIKEEYGCLRFYLCFPDAFIYSLEGYILDIGYRERYSKTKKLVDELKTIVNGNYPSNLKEIARILNIDMNYWKFTLAADTKQKFDRQYNESKVKEFVFYGENDEEDEKLAKEYKTVLDGLYNLLVRYISNITGVVDGFAKYFSNIDKDTLKTSLVGYVSLQGNEDVAKHAKMIDKAVNKS